MYEKTVSRNVCLITEVMILMSSQVTRSICLHMSSNFPLLHHRSKYVQTEYYVRTSNTVYFCKYSRISIRRTHYKADISIRRTVNFRTERFPGQTLIRKSL